MISFSFWIEDSKHLSISINRDYSNREKKINKPARTSAAKINGKKLGAELTVKQINIHPKKNSETNSWALSRKRSRNGATSCTFRVLSFLPMQTGIRSKSKWSSSTIGSTSAKNRPSSRWGLWLRSWVSAYRCSTPAWSGLNPWRT